MLSRETMKLKSNQLSKTSRDEMLSNFITHLKLQKKVFFDNRQLKNLSLWPNLINSTVDPEKSLKFKKRKQLFDA